MLFIITKGGMSTSRNVYKQGHFVMQIKHLLLSLQKKSLVVLTTEWLPWLQETVVYFGIRG